MKFLMLLSVLLFSSQATADNNSQLETLLQKAYNSSLLSAYRNLYEADLSLITSKSTPGNPMVAYSSLERGNTTGYVVIKQDIKFPLKYYYNAKSQSKLADSSKNEYKKTRLMVRQNLLSLYYAIFAVQKNIELTKANLRTLKDFARIAEKRYSAGKSPQSNSMRAHLSITKTKIDLIELENQNDILISKLKAIVNDTSPEKINLTGEELRIPKINEAELNKILSDPDNVIKNYSPEYKSEFLKEENLKYQKKLANWSYVPDFSLQYQERISGLPETSRIYSVGATIPLWFWKNNAEANAAFSKYQAQQNKVNQTVYDLRSDISNLNNQVRTTGSILKIYKTSLIPQSEGFYNSSKSAYMAKKISFFDFIDSERTLYKTKIDFYHVLANYIAFITEFETKTGKTISDLIR